MAKDEYFTPKPYVESARHVMGKIELDPTSCFKANETVKAERIFTIENSVFAIQLHVARCFSIRLIQTLCHTLNVLWMAC